MSGSRKNEAGPRLHYPVDAVAVIAAAWLMSALDVAFFSFGSLILLPLLPVFFAGPLCLIASAHQYAHKRARARATTRDVLAGFRVHAPHHAT